MCNVSFYSEARKPGDVHAITTLPIDWRTGGELLEQTSLQVFSCFSSIEYHAIIVKLSAAFIHYLIPTSKYKKTDLIPTSKYKKTGFIKKNELNCFEAKHQNNIMGLP